MDFGCELARQEMFLYKEVIFNMTDEKPSCLFSSLSSDNPYSI